MWEIGEDLSFKGWTSGFHDWLDAVLRVAYQQKEPHVEHMTRRWKSCQAIFSRMSRGKGQPTKDPQKFLFGKKLGFALPCLYSHYIYPHYPQIIMSAFQRKITLENTLMRFSSTPTSPSLYPWEVTSPNT